MSDAGARALFSALSARVDQAPTYAEAEQAIRDYLTQHAALFPPADYPVEDCLAVLRYELWPAVQARRAAGAES